LFEKGEFAINSPEVQSGCFTHCNRGKGGVRPKKKREGKGGVFHRREEKACVLAEKGERHNKGLDREKEGGDAENEGSGARAFPRKRK